MEGKGKGKELRTGTASIDRGEVSGEEEEASLSEILSPIDRGGEGGGVTEGGTM